MADNRGPELLAVALAFSITALAAVALRCYTAIALLGKFHLADWLAVVTAINQLAFCLFVILGVSHGLGKHVVDVAEDERPKALVWKFAGQVSYIIGSTLVKFVAGLLLLRLFKKNVFKWQRIVIIALLVLVGTFNIAYLCIAVFQCTPVQYFWFRYMENPPIAGYCNSAELATIPTYIAIVLGVVGDWMLSLLPISLVYNSRMDRSTKFWVCGILALGSMASIATCARIPYAKQLLKNPDYLYNFTDLAIWSIIEVALAVIASSLATLRPLFIKLRIMGNARMTSKFSTSPSRSRSRGLSNTLKSFHPRSISDTLAGSLENKMEKGAFRLGSKSTDQFEMSPVNSVYAASPTRLTRSASTDTYNSAIYQGPRRESHFSPPRSDAGFGFSGLDPFTGGPTVPDASWAGQARDRAWSDAPHSLPQGRLRAQSDDVSSRSRQFRPEQPPMTRAWLDDLPSPKRVEGHLRKPSS